METKLQKRKGKRPFQSGKFIDGPRLYLWGRIVSNVTNVRTEGQSFVTQPHEAGIDCRVALGSGCGERSLIRHQTQAQIQACTFEGFRFLTVWPWCGTNRKSGFDWLLCEENAQVSMCASACTRGCSQIEWCNFCWIRRKNRKATPTFSFFVPLETEKMWTQFWGPRRVSCENQRSLPKSRWLLLCFVKERLFWKTNLFRVGLWTDPPPASTPAPLPLITGSRTESWRSVWLLGNAPQLCGSVTRVWFPPSTGAVDMAAKQRGLWQCHPTPREPLSSHAAWVCQKPISLLSFWELLSQTLNICLFLSHCDSDFVSISSPFLSNILYPPWSFSAFVSFFVAVPFSNSEERKKERERMKEGRKQTKRSARYGDPFLVEWNEIVFATWAPVPCFFRSKARIWDLGQVAHTRKLVIVPWDILWPK